MASAALEALRELVAALPRLVAERLALGARKALERGGDLAYLYHEASKLGPGYLGAELPYPERDEYWLTHGGPCTALPEPLKTSGLDALEAIRLRRSRRSYSREPLSLTELATVLYHAVGVTGTAWWGGPKRAYPSAGALQPVEAYVAAGRVEALKPGLYHYHPGRHCLELIRRGDPRRLLSRIALHQEHVEEAPAVIILTAVYPRTAWKYGLRAYRYIHWDAGFAGENIYIAAEALGLATVAVGAFYDDELCKLLEASCDEEIPMLLFPLGRRAPRE